MSRDEDIVAIAKTLMYMGVLGGPIGTALGLAIEKCAPSLIVKAVALTRMDR